MGLTFSNLFLGKKKEVKILMVGLKEAGKTTILYRLKLGEVVTTTPATGFTVEMATHKQTTFIVFDIGGQDQTRSLWRHYLTDTQGLIFVVDSNNRERMDKAKEELTKLLEEDGVRDCVLLVFANKQDLPMAMSVSDIQERLGLNTLTSRQWFVQPTCGQGHGLHEGLDWFSNQLFETK